MVATEVTNSSAKGSALTHTIHQEYVFFNPHLFEPTEKEELVYGILMPVFGVLSVLANLLVFVTLFHKNRTRGVSALSLILQCLAGYDTWVASLSMVIYTVPELLRDQDWAWEYLNVTNPSLMPYLFPLLHMGITGSDYLNLAAAVERYCALEGPFRKRSSPNSGCSRNNTWFYITAIFIGTFLFNLPMIWERETVELASSTDGVLEVVPTPLRFHDVYIKLYRLTMEFLVFKATPFFSFFILFLSLKDRIKFYLQKEVKPTLTVDQYYEIMDSRIILGINTLFYLTSTLPVYISLCHITLFHVDDDVARIGNLLIVINSTFKFFIYVTLSRDFRLSLKRLFVEDSYYWEAQEEKNKQFLGHAKVVSFVQASSK